MARKGDYGKNKGKTWKLSPEAIARRLGKPSNNKGKKNPRTQEYRANQSIALKKYVERSGLNFPLPPSKLEDLVASSLPTWHRQFRISSYIVDFALPEEKKVIEIFGCYWHACEICKLTKHDFAREVRSRDKQRLNTLQSKGWLVQVFWEHELQEGNVIESC